MTRSLLSLLIFALAGGLLVAGCDSAGSTDDTGRVRILLTDAPGDLAEAFVTIDRVELCASETEDGCGLVLTDEDFEVDLLTLQDGVTATLADAEVPAGTYEQLRFIVKEEATVVLESGEEQRLKVPSGTETGIKIVLGDLVVDGDGPVEILLDFEVESSFVRAGASGKYIFKPVVRLESITDADDEVDEGDDAYAEVEGAITGLDADVLTVEGVAFTLTGDTEYDDTSRDALAVGDFVEVEGAPGAGDTLVALDVEGQDEDDAGEREIEAPVDALGDASLTVLGQPIAVTDATDFEGVAGLGDLAVGDRVEVEFSVDGDAKTALEVEVEDGSDDDEEEDDDSSDDGSE